MDAADLTDAEQHNVRVALRALRHRFGTWAALADVLRYKPDSVKKATYGGDRITPTIAFRVARLVDAGIDDLLAGKFRLPGQCPTCGHVMGAGLADKQAQLSHMRPVQVQE